MTEKQFKKGDIIFREGDMGETLYQIKEGSVCIYTGYDGSDVNLLVELGKGKFFGEMAAIEAYPRSATAVAKEDVTVTEIASNEVGSYFKSEPDRIMDIMKSLGGRLRDLTVNFDDVSDTIKELGFLEGNEKSEGLAQKIKKFAAVYKRNKSADAISQETLRKNSKGGHSEGYSAKVETYPKGTVIFKEGEIGDCMYDIHFGSVGIYKAYGTADEKLLAKLSTDEFFGELGMIDDVKRSGTAVVLENDTTIEIITPDDLKGLFEQNPPKVEMILEHVSYRLRKLTKEYMKACSLLSRVSDSEIKGTVSEELKSEIKSYTAKLYD